tara:strand:- start:213 stop:1058 length:846 start_codon:yes stop_codon:yes gene_type:complete
MNCNEILHIAESILKKNFINSPKLESEILLAKVLKVERENLLLNLNMKLNYNQKEYYYSLINRRKKKEPIAYIIGYKEFWKKKYLVNKNVLIPRPDTEVLVEEAIKHIPPDKTFNILDVGTGSGCLLLSILNERKKCYGTGIDISKKSISVAKYNAKIQHIKDRVKFLVADVDKFLFGKYDLIVSNPPYIKKHRVKYLDADVSVYEPRLALDGGRDGLSKLILLIKKSSILLKNNGKMIIEIDSNQVFSLRLLLRRNNFYINNISKDLSGRNRCLVCTKLN